MSANSQAVRFYRRRIPAFECIPGCHDCCGPVMATPEEMARLPVKSDAECNEALAEWRCVHLAEDGCRAYDERPLICRLFGTTESLRCPHGRRPEMMTALEIEARIFEFMRQTRQVLV